MAGLGFIAFVLPGGFWVSANCLRLALLSLTPALWVLKPWRTVGRITRALVLASAAGATIVFFAHDANAPTAPYRVYYELLVFLLVACYASRRAVALRVVVSLFAVVVLELVIAGWSWWRGGDPTALLQGTIHWHNQLAAFLLVPAIIATAAYVQGPMSRLMTVTCVLMSMLTGTAIVLTTSRAGLGLFVLAWLSCAVLVPTSAPRALGLIRWLSVPALIILLTRVLTAAWLFPGHTYDWPLLSDGGRGTATMAGNTTARVTYIEAALHVFQHHLLTGTGFNSFPNAASTYLPAGTPPVFGVYDLWADALAAGGLVYGVPVLLVGLAVAVLACRLARHVHRIRAEVGVHAGVALAVVALYGHLSFDLDTYYPQVMTMAAAATGLAYAQTRVQTHSIK